MNNEHLLLTEDEKDYHAKAGKEFLSSHLLSAFRHCPLIYNQMVNGSYRRPDSNAYILGRATHALILEGEKVYAGKYTYESPVNPKTDKPYGCETKKFTEWANDMRACGMEPITPDDNMLAWKMYDSVANHHLALELLTKAPYRERVVRTKLYDIPCQSRMDAFGFDVGIVDLKTCMNLDKFKWQAKDFNYIEQLAFYRAVLRAAEIDCPAVYIIAVEKKFPYRTGRWKIEEGSLDLAETINCSAMDDLSKCQDINDWPTGYENERLLSI